MYRTDNKENPISISDNMEKFRGCTRGLENSNQKIHDRRRKVHRPRNTKI